MQIVTLSPKFQVVIPRDVREAAGLVAGTKLEVINYGGRIELVPLRPMKTLRGVFKGIDTGIDREPASYPKGNADVPTQARMAEKARDRDRV